MMSHALLFAVLLFPGYVVIHAIVNRLTGARGFLKVSLQLWIPYVLAAHAYFVFLQPLFAVFSFLFSFSIWSFYMLVLVAARNSVTLRMMDEIQRAGGLTHQELNERVPDDQSVEVRFQAMQRGGLLTRSDGELALTKKGMRLGKMAMILRKLFSLGVAG